MNLTYIALLSFCVIVPLVWRFLKKESYNWYELAINVLVAALITTGIWYFDRYPNSTDYEVWNGEVLKNYSIKEDCPWGWQDYQDNFCTEFSTRIVQDGQTCTTDSNGNRSCTPNYKTQYNYVYDWERRYFVDTNVHSGRYEINRVDRQGVTRPPLHEYYDVGSPVSRINRYDNWVKAASNSLFHRSEYETEQYREEGLIPEYPLDAIREGLQVNRVISVNVREEALPRSIDEMSRALENRLRYLGPSVQMNAVVVLVNGVNEDYIYALQRAWEGFKKNDAVIVLLTDGTTVSDVQVESWSKNELFDVTMRDELEDYFVVEGNTLDTSYVFDTLMGVGTSYFERREMAEFEYLKNEIPPSTLTIVLIIIIGWGSTIGLMVFFHKSDFFEKDRAHANH